MKIDLGIRKLIVGRWHTHTHTHTHQGDLVKNLVFFTRQLLEAMSKNIKGNKHFIPFSQPILCVYIWHSLHHNMFELQGAILRWTQYSTLTIWVTTKVSKYYITTHLSHY
jgi:hypothetical protein